MIIEQITDSAGLLKLPISPPSVTSIYGLQRFKCNACEKVWRNVQDYFHLSLRRNKEKKRQLMRLTDVIWIRGERVVAAFNEVMLEARVQRRCTPMQLDLWLQNYCLHPADGTSGLNTRFRKLQMCNHLEPGWWVFGCCIVKSLHESFSKRHSCPVTSSKLRHAAYPQLPLSLSKASPEGLWGKRNIFRHYWAELLSLFFLFIFHKPPTMGKAYHLPLSYCSGNCLSFGFLLPPIK